MKVIPFKAKHIQQAAKLAELSFKEENNRLNNILPKEDIPDLSHFMDNNLGVAAFDEDTMLGFICCYGPINNLFGTSEGIYSPLYANSAVAQNRQRIYSAMYEYASDVWVKHKLLSHSITLYANDTDAINSFFDNGFGKRCVDGIKDTNRCSYDLKNTDSFYELDKKDFSRVHKLNNLTKCHLQKPPAFMYRKPDSLYEFLDDITDDVRIFAAQKNNELFAYLKVQNQGETFISHTKDMMNITGAYILNEYRGQGIFNDLMYYAIDILKKDGYNYLGTDYESINPTANNFWQKHFTPYTYSLTRRIDERILKLR